jgi:hypothetical protein
VGSALQKLSRRSNSDLKLWGVGWEQITFGFREASTTNLEIGRHKSRTAIHNHHTTHRNVILFFLFFSSGAPLLSMPVKTSNSANSGRIVARSSSSPIKSRSTHCSTAIVVMSLVHDAINIMASSSKGFFSPSLREWTPKDAEYLKAPVRRS